MISSFIDLDPSNTTWMTPNRRLSAVLLKQHQYYQIEQSENCWISLDILPIASWIQRLWDDWISQSWVDTPMVLTTHQENALWLDLIKQSPESACLLQVTNTAKLAKSAWSLLKQWRVKITDPELALTDDGRSFQTWAKQFDLLCKKQHWVDTQSVADLIAEQIQKKNILPPQNIVLVGFNELSPQYQYLFSQCEAMGSCIHHRHSTTSASSIKKIAMPDDETELRTMARWAKSLYDQAQEKKPFLIGCVIPQLESIRYTVLQIFSDVFSEKNKLHSDITSLPFNISAGQSLATFPCIYAALELLALHTGHIYIDTLSSILRSPFLGDAEKEQLKRAHFDNKIHHANKHVVTVSHLIDPHDSYALSHTCPALFKRFKKYAGYLANLQEYASPREWVTHFMTLLDILGWPGERSLNSIEYQATQRWLTLLHEFSGFDFCFERMNIKTAIDYLVQITKDTIFQPQTPEAPIQILGVLEAAGLPFDYLWVTQLEDSQWPTPPKPNPLLPQRLQKTLQMPHATPERELLYYKKLIEQLQCSVKNVIFSYPMQRGDTELRPSSLIHHVEEIDLNQLPLSQYTSVAEIIFQHQSLDLFEDKKASPVTHIEKIRGGTTILKLQAICPFKAFAELRLYANEPDPVTLGIKTQDRGTLVHQAMEFFWKQIKDSNRLAALSSDELDEIIHTAAFTAIELKRFSKMFQQRYKMLELERLKRVLKQWMEIELLRPSFKVIFTEYEKKISIGNIPIILRIDRIDELEDGQQMIIDYKTGKHNDITHWFSDRPSEPQLPLYCIASDEEIHAISYAQIHPDEMRLKGISRDDIGIHSIKSLTEYAGRDHLAWSDQVAHWQTVLSKLGDDFLQGIATVDPKNGNETCRLCHLSLLCRIREKTA